MYASPLVNENIDTTVPFRHLRCHCRDGGVIVEIHWNAEDTVGVDFAQLSDSGRVDIGFLADENDDSAFGKHFLGASFADTATAASHNSNSVFEPELQVVLLKVESPTKKWLNCQRTTSSHVGQGRSVTGISHAL